MSRIWISDTQKLIPSEQIGRAISGLAVARDRHGMAYAVIQTATGLSVQEGITDPKEAKRLRDELAAMADWSEPPSAMHFVAARVICPEYILKEEIDTAVKKAAERFTHWANLVKNAGPIEGGRA